VVGEDEKLPEEQGILNQYIKEETCFATWIPSWRILVPEGYHLVSDMPYLIEIEDVHLVDFRKNPLYKNKENIRGTREVSENSNGNAVNKVTFNNMGAKEYDDTQVLRLYHIWDRREQKRLTVSMQEKQPHFEGDWPYDMEGLPYKPCIFEETLPDLDKSSPYPPGILKSILNCISD